MARGWSHTAEAYANVRDNIHKQDREWLEECWLELQKMKSLDYVHSIISDIPNDILADSIWQFASKQRTCDNGGFNAWCCPHGCHTVPFDAIPDTNA